jgi:hypothetical protein
MIIALTILFLFLAALILISINWVRLDFRYTWLIAAGGTLITWISVLTWHIRLPLTLQFPRWEPSNLFLTPLSFTVDSLTWAFAFSIVTLILAVILTAAARENFPAPVPWAATLVLGGLGLLAVLADNPLSLLMVWAAIDMVELVTQLRSVDGPEPSEKVVTAFATRIAGIGMLLWATMVSISTGVPMNFQETPSQAGLYLLLAAGLRLGVFPLHLPYASESAIRRGFGTALRLISAASSLILLARIPLLSVASVFTPTLLFFAAVAAIYGGLMWLRASDEMAARPFWLIGLASLATASALRGNSIGAAAWSCALILSGGALFLSSAQHVWLNRVLWVGVWGITALPISITATGWMSSVSSFWPVWPFLLFAQALLISGYIRHITRTSQRANFDSLDRATKIFYLAGISLLLGTLLTLGLWGWAGALKIGAALLSMIGTFLAILVTWLAPRFRLLSPVRAHWIQPATSSWTDWFFRGLWGLYRLGGRLFGTFSSILEGDGGFMWTILLLVLLISILAQRTLGT